MKRLLTLTASVALCSGVFASTACAQKGMGNPTGLARRGANPEGISLSGKVVRVETGPCDMGTGRAGIGTHFLLEAQKGDKLNVHLGPAAAVNFVADQLRAGVEVTVEAFRTEKMPENHYVAKSLTLDGRTIRLRDDALRPFWQQGPAAPGRVDRPQYAGPSARGSCPRYGRGPGQGRGRGYGRGPGWGRGAAFGPGAGYGRGAGHGQRAGYRGAAGAGRAGAYGWGPGAGVGRGAGWGRGWAFLDEDRDGLCDNYERISAER